MPYLYDRLDVDDHLQLGCQCAYQDGDDSDKVRKENRDSWQRQLRSSSNIEQIVIEHSPAPYDFAHGMHAEIAEKHKTINKAVRRTDLWSAVLAGGEETPLPMAAQLAGV